MAVTLEIAGKDVEVSDNFLQKSDAEKQQIVNKIAQEMGAGGPKEEAGYGRMAESAISGAADMVTGENTDEIVAGLTTGFGYLGDYGKQKKAVRDRINESYDMAPGSYIAGSAGGLVGGGLAGAALKAPGALGALGRATGLKAAVGKGAAAGAGYEALQAAGQDRDMDLMSGAALGAGGGLVGAGLGRLVGNRLRGGKSADKVRRDNIEGQAIEGFDQFDKVKMNPNILEKGSQLSGSIAAKRGLNNPSVVGQLQKIEKELLESAQEAKKQGSEISGKTYRGQVAGSVSGKQYDFNGNRRPLTPTESHGSQTVKKRMASNIKNNVTQPVGFKNAAEAAEKLTTSNSQWSAVKKYDDLMERFSKAVNKRDLEEIMKDKSLMDGLTPETKAVLQKYSKEGSIQKILSWLGYMSPLRMVNSAFSMVYNPMVGAPVLGAQAGAAALTKGMNSKMTREVADALFDRFEKRQRDGGAALGGIGSVGIFGGDQ